MKLVKMSLAAAMLMGASAFAIDNIKVSGDAKLLYGTNDSGTMDLFDQGNSYADTALRVGVTGDLTKGVSFGLTGTAVSTLGLENNLVANTWTGAHNLNQAALATGKVDVEDQMWINEAWIAATLGKTTAKLGRMQLDTPLAFSETWSLAANTFDAAVLINQDIPDTTLIGAWVGKGNGNNALAPATVVGWDGIMAPGAAMTTFASKGAYAAAAINNSFKPLTVQAWYYNVVNVADAYWLQADWDCQLIKDVKVGVQYANMDTKGVLAAAKDSSAYAAKLAYAGVKNLKVSAAYSKADKDGTLKIANVATDNLSATPGTGAQSKLYTEAWMNYGYVGAAGAESVNVTAEYDAGIAKLAAYYTTVDNEIVGNTHNVDEATLTVSKSFGPLDATLAYYSTDAADQNGGKQYNTVQAYLTLNF